LGLGHVVGRERQSAADHHREGDEQADRCDERSARLPTCPSGCFVPASRFVPLVTHVVQLTFHSDRVPRSPVEGAAIVSAVELRIWELQWKSRGRRVPGSVL
jgi:hypothetical protein